MKKNPNFYPFFSNDQKMLSKASLKLNLKKQRKISHKETEKKIIHVQQENMKKQLAILEWRKTTNFPIVKVHSFQILNLVRKDENKELPTKVELSLQRIELTLQNINQIALSSIIYLLKETLIAAQRLSQNVGYFIFASNMVGINQNGKCKVWINSKFQSNKSLYPCKSQQQMVKSLISLFKNKTKDSLNSMFFYKQISKCESFIKSLKVIKDWIITHKLRVPNTFIYERDSFESRINSSRKYVQNILSCDRRFKSQQNPEQEKFKRTILQNNGLTIKDQKEKGMQRRTTISYFSQNLMKRAQVQSFNLVKNKKVQETVQQLRRIIQKRSISSPSVNYLIHTELEQSNKQRENNMLLNEKQNEIKQQVNNDWILIIPKLSRNERGEKKQGEMSSFLIDQRDNQQEEYEYEEITDFMNKMLGSTVDEISFNQQINTFDGTLNKFGKSTASLLESQQA